MSLKAELKTVRAILLYWLAAIKEIGIEVPKIPLIVGLAIPALLWLFFNIFAAIGSLLLIIFFFICIGDMWDEYYAHYKDKEKK